MKKILNFLLLFVSIASYAAKPQSMVDLVTQQLSEKVSANYISTSNPVGYTNVYNVQTDMPFIDPSLVNLNGDSTHGDSKLLQAVIDMITSKHLRIKLFFPNLQYRFDTTVNTQDYIWLEGIKDYTRFVSDVNFGGIGSGTGTDLPLILSIGHSNQTFINITFSNNHSKDQGAFIQFNSDPNKCVNNRVLYSNFTESQVRDAINFGAVSPQDTTAARLHYNDLVLIESCNFINLYKTGVVHINPDLGSGFPQYFTDVFCSGVNLRQSTLRAIINSCVFYGLSGDPVFEYGKNKYYSTLKYSLATTITNCSFDRGNMFIEVNGNYGGSDLVIDHNTFGTPWIFCISTSCDNEKIINNTAHIGDKGFLETTSTGAIIRGNQVDIHTWKDSTHDGYPRSNGKDTLLSTKVFCIQLYGNANLIEGNIFTIDPTNRMLYSPKIYDGIAIFGSSTDMRAGTQRTTFMYNPKYTGFDVVQNNSIYGFTGTAIEMTIDPITRVKTTGNNFTSPYCTSIPVLYYGWDGEFSNNTVDITNSPEAASTDSAYFVLSSVQTDTSLVSYRASNDIIRGNFVYPSYLKIPFKTSQYIQAINSNVTSDIKIQF